MNNEILALRIECHIKYNIKIVFDFYKANIIQIKLQA